jgi:hypothetical protein
MLRSIRLYLDMLSETHVYSSYYSRVFASVVAFNLHRLFRKYETVPIGNTVRLC